MASMDAAWHCAQSASRIAGVCGALAGGTPWQLPQMTGGPDHDGRCVPWHQVPLQPPAAASHVGTAPLERARALVPSGNTTARG